MSMCPFFAARCKGLVPFGSVMSPGLGSSKAAHMLLFKSSCTTWGAKHKRETADMAQRLRRSPPFASMQFLPRHQPLNCNMNMGLKILTNASTKTEDLHEGKILCSNCFQNRKEQGRLHGICPAARTSFWLLVFQTSMAEKFRLLIKLTPTRPNSHAKSRGVLPQLSRMQGLDWC